MSISPLQRLLITVAVMSATLMQVLDTTIVNVALPHMQGSLGTTPDQITWTLTSYLVSSAIFMPLTGYFTDKLGRKAYLLISIIGFTLVSALCGASTSLTEIVIFRLLQGIFGAALVPLSQAILTDVYPVEERGKAMAIWGMGVMVGPILGPTLGGYLTEIANWRWTFYVNVPVGIFSALLAWKIVPDTPKKERYMDWQGLLLISTAIAGFQYFLDRGNTQDWFNARDIQIAAGLCIMSMIGFIWHCLHPSTRSVFDLRIFKDLNFTLASILIALMGLGMYGTMVIQPLMLENLLNYPVLMTGLVMAPRGVSGMVSMLLVSKIIGKIDIRWIISLGVLMNMLGVYICTFYSFMIDPFWIIVPLLLQGFGTGLIFVPLSTVAFTTLPDTMRAEATGLYSLLRTLGASIGISITSTFFSRHVQMAWNHLGGFIQPYNTAISGYLQSLNINYQNPLGAVLLGNELGNQAQMVAFVNTYAFIMWSFLLMLPLVWLIKKKLRLPTLHVTE